MFGIGGSEILVILIVALLFLGPDKLPDAAKQISKGIRDLKKQSRVLQQTIENDEHIGGAIRDLKSALRGEEIPVRPPVRKLPENTIAKPAEPEATAETNPEEPAAEVKPSVTLPQVAGEVHEEHQLGSEDLAGLVKPPPGETAAREPAAADDVPKQKHG